MWLELCTDSHEDWQKSLRACALPFAKSPWYSNTDRSTSIAFVEKYFEYLFETQLSHDRAGLACAKTRNPDGSISIAYVAVWAWNRSTPTTGDISAMRRQSIWLTDDVVKTDLWLENAVHAKLQATSTCLDLTTLFCVFDATAPDFTGRGIGRKYVEPAHEMLFWDAVRRGKIDKRKPCLLYGIIDDPRVAQFTIRGNFREIAHIHESGDSVCLKTPSSAYELCDGCVLVTGKICPGRNEAEDKELLRQISVSFENNLTKFYRLKSCL